MFSKKWSHDQLRTAVSKASRKLGCDGFCENFTETPQHLLSGEWRAHNDSRLLALHVEDSESYRLMMWSVFTSAVYKSMKHKHTIWGDDRPPQSPLRRCCQVT